MIDELRPYFSSSSSSSMRVSGVVVASRLRWIITWFTCTLKMKGGE